MPTQRVALFIHDNNRTRQATGQLDAVLIPPAVRDALEQMALHAVLAA